MNCELIQSFSEKQYPSHHTKSELHDVFVRTIGLTPRQFCQAINLYSDTNRYEQKVIRNEIATRIINTIYYGPNLAYYESIRSLTEHLSNHFGRPLSQKHVKVARSELRFAGISFVGKFANSKNKDAVINIKRLAHYYQFEIERSKRDLGINQAGMAEKPVENDRIICGKYEDIIFKKLPFLPHHYYILTAFVRTRPLSLKDKKTKHLLSYNYKTPETQHFQKKKLFYQKSIFDKIDYVIENELPENTTIPSELRNTVLKWISYLVDRHGYTIHKKTILNALMKLHGAECEGYDIDGWVDAVIYDRLTYLDCRKRPPVNVGFKENEVQIDTPPEMAGDRTLTSKTECSGSAIESMVNKSRHQCDGYGISYIEQWVNHVRTQSSRFKITQTQIDSYIDMFNQLKANNENLDQRMTEAMACGWRYIRPRPVRHKTAKDFETPHDKTRRIIREQMEKYNLTF